MEPILKQEKGEHVEPLMQWAQRLASAQVNDAVKLAFIGEDEIGQISGMDLMALSEFKRHGNGAVEMKFMNRLELVQWLLELLGNGQDSKADAFFQALDSHAGGGPVGI